VTPQQERNANLAANDLRAFVALTSLMREAQKTYFKFRDKDTLIDSKSLEAQVDAAIRIVKSRD
jgi:hypothetical protein